MPVHIRCQNGKYVLFTENVDFKFGFISVSVLWRKVSLGREFFLFIAKFILFYIIISIFLFSWNMFFARSIPSKFILCTKILAHLAEQSYSKPPKTLTSTFHQLCDHGKLPLVPHQKKCSGQHLWISSSSQNWPSCRQKFALHCHLPEIPTRPLGISPFGSALLMETISMAIKWQ